MKSNREYYGFSYRIIRLVRYIILMIFVLFTVFSLAFYKNDITFDNFRYLMKFVELSPPGGTVGSGTFTFSADSDTNFAILGKNLVAANGKKIVSYGMNGKKILDEELSFRNPKVVENGEYMLIYEFGGQKLCVFNSFSLVCEKKLDTPISYACLSDDGSFAVITNEKNYAGGVMAYNNKYQHIFSFGHTSSAVTDLCFDGERGILACATTTVRDGDFLSELLVFDTKSEAEEVKSTAFIKGELPLNMFCTKDGFALMTDKGIHFFDDACNPVSNFDFSYDTPSAIYKFDDFFAVTLKSALADTDTTVVVLNYSGKKLYSENFISEISHIEHNADTLFILDTQKLSIYRVNEANAFSQIENVQHDGRYKKVFGTEDDRYILVSLSGSQGGKIADEHTNSNVSAP